MVKVGNAVAHHAFEVYASFSCLTLNLYLFIFSPSLYIAQVQNNVDENVGCFFQVTTPEFRYSTLITLLQFPDKY